MPSETDTRMADIQDRFRGSLHTGLVRVVVCGNSSANKSALVERLGCDAKTNLPEAFDPDSPDITYRTISTLHRTFLIANVSGHGRYASRFAAAASMADVVIVVIDSSNWILSQTHAYLYLMGVIGVRRPVVAITEERFRDVEEVCRSLAQRVGLPDLACIPISVAAGCNTSLASDPVPGFVGPTLIDFLDSVPLEKREAPFRMPVQRFIKNEEGLLSIAGTVASGEVRVNDRVRIQPSGAETYVKRIATHAIELPKAGLGETVALVLADDVNISSDSMISNADAPAQVADQFDATVVWSGDSPMLRGRTYMLAIGSTTVFATIAPLKYKVNVQTLEHVAAEKLSTNEIGVCELELSRAVPFDPYTENRATGSFELIDRMTNCPVGVGILNFALRRAHNVHAHALAVSKASRSALKAQKSCVLWLTGIPASGKSTIANLIDAKLHIMGRHTYLLDGDNVRHGLNKDLGFNAEDRVENIRRVAEVAKLMVDAGLIVLAAFISPFRSERRMARELLPPGEFIEIFVDTPLSLAEQRDPKGLYKKARRGEIKNFTGIDSPYEIPEAAEIRLETMTTSTEVAADTVIAYLRDAGMLV